MYTISNEAQNPRYDETHCTDHHGNQLKSCFYKSEQDDSVVDTSFPITRSANFEVGNQCMPVDYFNLKDLNGADKHGCVLQENLNG